LDNTAHYYNSDKHVFQNSSGIGILNIYNDSYGSPIISTVGSVTFQMPLITFSGSAYFQSNSILNINTIRCTQPFNTGTITLASPTSVNTLTVTSNVKFSDSSSQTTAWNTSTAVWYNQIINAPDLNTSTLQVAYATTAGYAVSFNTGTLVKSATNLVGGNGGDLVTQVAPNVTGFASNIAYFPTGTGNFISNAGQTFGVSTGGMGVTGDSYFANNLGIGSSLYIAGDLYVDGTQFVVNRNTISSGDKALVLSTGSTSPPLAQGAGMYIGPTSSTSFSSFYYDGLTSWVIGGSSGGGLIATGTAGTNSTATGALTVAGGAGFGGGLYVGANITATNVYANIYANNTATIQVGYATTAGFASSFNTGTLVATAVSLLNTSTTQVGYATTAGFAVSFNTATLVTQAVSLLNTSTTQVGYATTAGFAVSFNTATLVTQAVSLLNTSTTQVGYATTAGFANSFNTGTLVAQAVSLLNTSTTQVGYATTAGFASSFTTSTLVTSAVNIANGVANQIPYQTAAGTTAFSAGLTYNGSTFTSTNHVVPGTATIGSLVFVNATETVYAWGAGVTGTITPNMSSGTVHTMTLGGNITLNALASAVAGSSMTIIINQPASGGPYTMTSSMKWAGGNKTLSLGASAIDIVTVFYDGSIYYGALTKGYA
jgi:hypothetical protein